ncbi:hypothetical protein LTS17_001374 [Exophiala oligosperma]
MNKFNKTPTADEVFIITGTSPGGLGAETARAICREHPALVILAGRDVSKIRRTQSLITDETPEVNVRILEIDLGSQRSVRKAAREINETREKIDVLINNAGVMASNPFSTSPEGIETQFATNHIGHFLFTNLIMPKLLFPGPGGGGRVINVSSSGHKRGAVRFDDHNFQNGIVYDKWKAYGQSKTANMLFSVSLAEKLGPKGLRSYSLYPGRILTNIIQNITVDEMKRFGWLDENGNMIQDPILKWKTLATGPSTQIVAAFDPSIEDYNGSYLDDCQIADDHAEPYALDKDCAERLWALSEKLVGQTFNY